MDVIYYEVNLEDDGSGLLRTSLVDEPAIGEEFDKFDALEIEKFDKEEDKRIVTGPVMIPNLKMLRKYAGTNEYYYGVFTAESILNTVKKASKENKFNFVNLNHSEKEEDIVKCAYLIESLILSDDNKPEKFSHLPNGTWIASWWIEDVDYWNDVIKSDNFRGFSVEIVTEKKTEDEMSDEERFSIINSILDSDINDNHKAQMILKFL